MLKNLLNEIKTMACALILTVLLDGVMTAEKRSNSDVTQISFMWCQNIEIVTMADTWL